MRGPAASSRSGRLAGAIPRWYEWFSLPGRRRRRHHSRGEEEEEEGRGGGVFSLPLKRGRGGGGGDPNGPRGMSRVLPKGIIPTEMVRATEKII